MRKFLSFIAIISLLLSFALPVAHAGTISKTVQAVSNKVQYITAGEFVTSLLMGAKVKPNGIADYWGKAVSMGLIPGEVKKNKPLTRAQASYIVWKLINAVPELKKKNIPVSVRRVPPTEAFMRGICFYGGPGGKDDAHGYVEGYDLSDFIQGYQLLVMEYKYADGRSEIKYVWDRYKGITFDPVGRIAKITRDFLGLINEFKKKYPDKVVYAPRPWQKGWLFTMDAVRDSKGAHFDSSMFPANPVQYADAIVSHTDRLKEFIKLGYPITRQDIAQINYYYYSKKQEIFKGYYGTYNIKEHPYFNMYFEDFLVNYPRKYPTDHTRFAYYCKDYYKIPQLYREPMLRLADLGIITPDQSALYVGVYYFNPAKTLTRAEAVQMIARVFNKSKRDVLDEVTVKQYEYWEVQNEIGLGKWQEYDYEKKRYEDDGLKFDDYTEGLMPATQIATFRIEEPMAMSFAKTVYKIIPAGYYGIALAQQGSGNGYDLSYLGGDRLGFYLYDEIDAEKLKVQSNGKVLSSFIPLAYRDEFMKDLNTFTVSKLKAVSNTYEVLKQYGNIFVSFRLEPYYKKTINYCIYTVVPKYALDYKKDYPLLTAKPNPKYKQ
ncbi:S-layer homology domain-containing protein [Anaerocellum danielii]|uniref:S-layer homology domain-containing protein n=1 Tax=Anaerocellum danielii TaxID=1387557 RepID=A0ABZ0U2A7_9FIRM|nr:S-layer homology domain-containing protein [Caldicellulosiruptor danielii]WPX08868.1 S-layer homology domain-containing protein [Caldicellulosiruptor danielii]